ncbi:hypothetical protein [Pseudomonas sp. p106]|uniref:hypothetical protein n=1 Tax=Pseudomonas sp. p106 TaxID=2479854 RepID=UPI000F7BA968|nr:hypothetical protein [Pseudomonas sp. p106]RRV49589.1 hypothetical protein EGJ09_01240 [Pseudomonas sp. p106]
MKGMVLVGVASLALAGCFDKGETNTALSGAKKAVSEIKVSNVSPDMTVKSWWALKDAGIRLNDELCTELVKSRAELEEKTKAIADDELNFGTTCSTVTDRYERKIESVDVQSDTRAIVTALIKNTTPPDPGASLDSEEQANKEKGYAFKYLLERSDANSGWSISQVSKMAFYSRSWDDVYKKPKPYNHIYVNENDQ